MDMHRTHPPDPVRENDPAHSSHFDTVAQKPTHIGSGTKTSEPAVGAHTHHVEGSEAPEETQGTKFGHAHRVAAGLPAVYQSARFTLKEMGFLRGLKTWLEVNQKTGFDCQSCAWPSPDEHRHAFEFCESGVKAVSDEATRTVSRAISLPSIPSPTSRPAAISGSGNRGDSPGP